MTASKGEIQAAVAEGESLLFLTNRFNVLRILSSGFIGPRAWFPKYYKDLLDQSPGRIVLFRGGVSQSVGNAVLEEGETSLPVILEIETEALGSLPLPALTSEGVGAQEPLGSKGCVAWAGSGCIPFFALRALHFRLPAEKEEFEARGYDNIPANAVPLAVTPALFETDGPDLSALLTWLKTLPDEDGPQREDLDRIDRTLGALNLITATLPGSPEHLGQLGALLAGTPVPQGTEGFPPWINDGSLRGEQVKAQRGIAAVDRELFPRATKILRGIEPARSWKPVDILEEVQASMSGVTLPKKEASDLGKAFHYGIAILKNEVAFKPFRHGSALPAAKGLLMALMRPGPEDLLAWPVAESGADLPTLLAAAAFCGLLQGHARLPAGTRTVSLDRFLSARGAADLGPKSRELCRIEPNDLRLQVERVSSDGEQHLALTWRGETVVTKALPPSSLIELLDALDNTDPNVQVGLIDVCERNSWGECVQFNLALSAAGARIQMTDGKPSMVNIIGLGRPNIVYSVDVAALRARLSSAQNSAESTQNIARDLRALRDTKPK